MRKHLTYSTAFVAVFCLTTPLHAVDLERGQDIARKCTVCHGKMGVAQDPEMPSLAGQSAFYLEKSLKDFQSGARHDRRMTLMAQPLSDQDIKDVSAWYASFVVTVTPPEQ